MAEEAVSQQLMISNGKIKSIFMTKLLITRAVSMLLQEDLRIIGIYGTKITFNLCLEN